MFNISFEILIKCCLLLIHIRVLSLADSYQDQTSSKPNTLFDDADDIQRQLDNEARDRIKYGRNDNVEGRHNKPKTVWVLHFPSRAVSPTVPMNFQNTFRPMSRKLLRYRREEEKCSSCETQKCGECGKAPTPASGLKTQTKKWSYAKQDKWAKDFPSCGGRSQSPVDLPASGLLRAKGARRLLFQNYGVPPKTATLSCDGNNVVFSGEWKKGRQPLIYGGAAHSRRYVFHSLTLHSPSEHRVGGLTHPLESQALFISAEYKDLDDAIASSDGDPQALLGVVSLYKFSNCTHRGTANLLCCSKGLGFHNRSMKPKPLGCFIPPFKQYACYQGSLTTPPCTESVLWLVRARAMCISRCIMNAVQAMVGINNPSKEIKVREPQQLNDRKVYFFK